MNINQFFFTFFKTIGLYFYTQKGRKLIFKKVCV